MVLHIKMADGIFDLGEILVRENDGTSLLVILYIKCIFCWCLLTNRLVQPHSLYYLTNNTDQVSPVTIRPASFCIFC